MLLRLPKANSSYAAQSLDLMADYNRDPKLLDEPAKMRGRPAHAVSVSYQESVRAYIRTANKNGEYITLENIREFLDKITNNEFWQSAFSNQNKQRQTTINNKRWQATTN